MGEASASGRPVDVIRERRAEWQALGWNGEQLEHFIKCAVRDPEVVPVVTFVLEQGAGAGPLFSTLLGVSHALQFLYEQGREAPGRAAFERGVMLAYDYAFAKLRPERLN